MSKDNKSSKLNNSTDYGDKPLEADPFSIIGALALPIEAVFRWLMAKLGIKK